MEKFRHRLSDECHAVRVTLGNLRAGAKARGLGWELTDEHAERLVLSKCHYCGIAGGNRVRRRGKHETSFAINGIDRMENSLGYVPANVVPCCGQCNMAKQSTPYAAFVEWLNRAGNHTFMQGAEIPPTG